MTLGQSLDHATFLATKMTREDDKATKTITIMINLL